MSNDHWNELLNNLDGKPAPPDEASAEESPQETPNDEIPGDSPAELDATEPENVDVDPSEPEEILSFSLETSADAEPTSEDDRVANEALDLDEGPAEETEPVAAIDLSGEGLPKVLWESAPPSRSSAPSPADDAPPTVSMTTMVPEPAEPSVSQPNVEATEEQPPTDPVSGGSGSDPWSSLAGELGLEVPEPPPQPTTLPPKIVESAPESAAVDDIPYASVVEPEEDDAINRSQPEADRASDLLDHHESAGDQDEGDPDSFVITSIFHDESDESPAPPTRREKPAASDEDEPNRGKKRRRGRRRRRREADEPENMEDLLSETVDIDDFDDDRDGSADAEENSTPDNGSEESDPRPKKRRRRRRRKPRKETETTVEADDSFEEDPDVDFGDDDPPRKSARGKGDRHDEDNDAEDGDKKHRKIPTWDQAIGVMVENNLKNRKPSDDRRGRRRR